jgi:hypothetical protein
MLSTIEMLFGPVLPGSSTPESTISVFRNRFSKQSYQLVGQVGIHPNALWYIHTPLPIDLTQVKPHVIAVSEDSNFADDAKRQRVQEWLAAHSLPTQP